MTIFRLTVRAVFFAVATLLCLEPWPCSVWAQPRTVAGDHPFVLVGTHAGPVPLYGLTSDSAGRIYVGNNSNDTTGIPVQLFDSLTYVGPAPIALSNLSATAVGDADGLAFGIDIDPPCGVQPSIFAPDRDQGVRMIPISGLGPDSPFLSFPVANNGPGSPLLYRPADGHLFVGVGDTTNHPSTITEYDCSGAIVRTFTTPATVEQMTFDPVTGFIYYAPYANVVRVLDPSNGNDTLVGTINGGPIDGGLFFDTDSQLLFIGSASGVNAGKVETMDPATGVPKLFAFGFSNGSVGVLREPVSRHLYFLTMNELYRLDASDVDQGLQCGDGNLDPQEQCDPGGQGGSPPPSDAACPGRCAPGCTCQGATPTPLNHFQCYEVHHGPFSRPGVSLDDSFGPGTVDVGKPKRLCAPADKNDEDPTAPQDRDHLAGYKIKQRTPAVTKLRDQVVVNQFGTQTVDVLKPDLLLVPSSKDLSGPPPPLNPAVVNHFKCHKVRGKFRRSGIKIDDQFTGTLTVDLVKPVRLCLRADKNGEGVINPPDALMCYKVRRPFAPPPGTVFVNNQFEQGPFDLFRPTEFCVPSQVNPGPQPTFTPTPVATLTPTPIQTPSLQCCGPFDQCIDTDGTASAGDGIPGAVEVLIGNPLTPFPAVFNNSGLHMQDNDGNAMWTFGPAGDDLIAEGPGVCPTGIHNGVYDLGLDCPVLDYDGSLFNGQIVDCDLEEGAFCMPPLPVPIAFHDTNLNGAWDDGEDIVLDMNGDGICD